MQNPKINPDNQLFVKSLAPIACFRSAFEAACLCMYLKIKYITSPFAPRDIKCSRKLS